MTAPQPALSISTPSSASAKPVHRYRAFGLAIESELRLDELAIDMNPGGADLRIRLLDVEHLPAPDALPLSFQLGEHEQIMEWSAVGRFRLIGDDLIEIARVPGASDELLHFPLLGPVLALALHRRGLLVLHASAVNVNGRGVVFLGDKLAGKSTTAAAFVAAGHGLLTDDILAIDFDTPGGPMIRPGFSQLKLDEQASVGVLGEHGTRHPLVLPGLPKRQHTPKAPFALDEVRPHRFYVLERGEHAGETRLASHAGAMALVRYSYAIRFPNAALAGDAAAQHFRQCAAMARDFGAYTLTVPNDLEALPDVVRLIEESCA